LRRRKNSHVRHARLSRSLHTGGPVVSDPVEIFILDQLKQSPRHLTVGDLTRIGESIPGCDRARVRRAVKHLVTAGEAQYTERFGCNFVEPAWCRPRWISPRVMLCPDNVAAESSASPGAVILRLAQGSAFGGGDHATTRLALCALDEMFCNAVVPAGAAALDIGTGSGVLAIAAVGLGAGSAVAVDIDPCAVWEARRNIALNGLVERIRVTSEPVENITGPFELVLANLRFPSLMRLTALMPRWLSADGAVVVSGIRPQERDALIATYGQIDLRPCWDGQSQDWVGIGFSRFGKKAEMDRGPQAA
jgi:ribosomal protein L11 methyltransferase